MDVSPRDARLGRLAVELGLLSAAQVRELLARLDAEAAAPAGPPAVPAPATAATLPARPGPTGSPPATSPAVAPPALPPPASEATLLRPPPGPATDAPSPASSAATLLRPDPVAAPAARVAAPPAGPHRTFGRYVLLEELGRGGMGVVYKAWRPDLQACFAIKVLLTGDDASADDVARFRREAQAAARLQHPGIVGVHDIGVEEGKTYFAMEFVDGASLDAILADPARHGLPPARGARPGRRSGVQTELAVLWAQEIAEAIHHAHECGVVHRDLKPANVLRERSGRLKVMDFGLAKLVGSGAAAGATRSGTLMGTPAYMSPEQAAGRVHDIDARSDVYQIGAILYELLTGFAPYEAENPINVVMKVVNEDPPSPVRHNPLLDRDAVTICLKAMARAKGARYASARELAEDCACYLRGDPVRARREAWWERGLRWARRRPALTASLALAVLAAGAAGVGLWVARVERGHRETAQAAVLAELRSLSRTSVDAALLLRRAGGKMEAARKSFLEPMRQAADKAAAQAPGLAEPHYCLGRMYRALLDFPQARAEQDRALVKQPGYAPARYERAILQAAALRERVALLHEEWQRRAAARLVAPERAGVPVAKEAGLEDRLIAADPEARALRDGIVRDLAALEAAAADPAASAAAVSPASRDCARGLYLCFTANSQADRDRARAVLQGAIQAEPTLEEAYEARVDLELKGGLFEEAIRIYTRGIEVDRGYVPHLLGRAAALHTWGMHRSVRGTEPDTAFAQAETDLARVLELDPRSVLARVERAQLFYHWGGCKEVCGQDPVECYQRAEADLVQAATLDPAASEVLRQRAEVRTALGARLALRGKDFAPVYGQAETDLARALALRPDAALTWVQRGELQRLWSSALGEQGKDPGPALSAAEAHFRKALELEQDLSVAWLGLGSIHSAWGLYRQDRDEDPDATYRQAESELRKACELDPLRASVWLALGALYRNWASSDVKRHTDPATRLAQAREQFDGAVKRNLSSAPAWLGRADAAADLGLVRAKRGEDPTALLREAEADYAKVLELIPGYAAAFQRRASMWRTWGGWQSEHGQDPAPQWDAAEADLERLVQARPDWAQGWRERAELRQIRAGQAAAAGRDPGPFFADAESDYGKMLELDPTASGAWWSRGCLRLTWANARLRRDPQADPEELLRGADADLRKSAELRPLKTAGAWFIRGNVHALWTTWRADRGGDAATPGAAALAAYDEALRLDPGLAGARWRRGLVCCALRRWGEAVADLEAAQKLDPAETASYAKELAEARLRMRAAEGKRGVSPWLESLQRGRELAQVGENAAAAQAYEEGLAGARAALESLPEAARQQILASPQIRATVGGAHYGLACADALRSVGRSAPGGASAAPAVPAAAEAAALRDQAFEHLREAVQLGAADTARLGAEAALEPLRTDPRWAEVLRAAGGVGQRQDGGK